MTQYHQRRTSTQMSEPDFEGNTDTFLQMHALSCHPSNSSCCPPWSISKTSWSYNIQASGQGLPVHTLFRYTCRDENSFRWQWSSFDTKYTRKFVSGSYRSLRLEQPVHNSWIGRITNTNEMCALLCDTFAAVLCTQTADANAKHRRTPEKPQFSWRTFIRYARLDVLMANHGATQTRLYPKAWFKAPLHDTKASSISLQWRRLKAWLTKWRRYLLVGQVATSGYLWVECHTNLEGVQSRWITALVYGNRGLRTSKYDSWK